MNKQMLLLILLTVMMNILCTNEVVKQDGATESRPAIIGTLRFSDGSPAPQIAVCLRNKKVIADIPINGTAKKTGAANIVVTDKNGTFTFSEYPEPGTYIVEAKNAGNGVLIDSVAIGSDSTPVNLLPVTLQPVGAIAGSVKLITGTLAGKMYLLIFGLDRFAEVNNDGTFIFSDLAPGSYYLRFICTGDGFDKFDTTNVEVKASATTMINSIVLPYSGIPVPQHLRASYDTLWQTATLTWSKIDPSLVNGYSVYRRNLDSNKTFTVPINKETIVDTFYTDATCQQNFTYEYRIAAVGKTDTISRKSDSVSATISSYFICDTELVLPIGSVPGTFRTVLDVDISSENLLYLLDDENRRIQVYDTLLRFIKQFPICSMFTGASKLAVEKSNSVLILGCTENATIPSSYESLFIRQNEEGTSFARIPPAGILSAIDAADSVLYVVKDTTLLLYTDDDSLVAANPLCGRLEGGKIHIVGNGDVAFYSRELSKIIICDRTGKKTGEIPLPQTGWVDDFAIDEINKRIYLAIRRECMDYSAWRSSSEVMLLMCDLNGSAIASYRKNIIYSSGCSNKLSVFLDSNKNVYFIEHGDYRDQKIIKLKPMAR